MSADEFNKKYADYLETGHYGLDIHKPEVIKYLDQEFQELIKIPGFKYTQIKIKFGYSRFYANGITLEKSYEIENEINKLYLFKS